MKVVNNVGVGMANDIHVNLTWVSISELAWLIKGTLDTVEQSSYMTLLDYFSLFNKPQLKLDSIKHLLTDCTISTEKYLDHSSDMHTQQSEVSTKS